jgi:hypothetical protein
LVVSGLAEHVAFGWRARQVANLEQGELQGTEAKAEHRLIR